MGGVHIADLVDQAPNVELVALFGPEHGIRGDVAAGEEVGDSVDPTTGVPSSACTARIELLLPRCSTASMS